MAPAEPRTPREYTPRPKGNKAPARSLTGRLDRLHSEAPEASLVIAAGFADKLQACDAGSFVAL
jgi:hypothetical protein